MSWDGLAAHTTTKQSVDSSVVMIAPGVGGFGKDAGQGEVWIGASPGPLYSPAQTWLDVSPSPADNATTRSRTVVPQPPGVVVTNVPPNRAPPRTASAIATDRDHARPYVLTPSSSAMSRSVNMLSAASTATAPLSFRWRLPGEWQRDQRPRGDGSLNTVARTVRTLPGSDWPTDYRPLTHHLELRQGL